MATDPDALDCAMLSPADFLYTDVLGAGSFGVVLSAQWARPEVAPSPPAPTASGTGTPGTQTGAACHWQCFAVKTLFRIDRLEGGNSSLNLQAALRREEQHCRRVHDARPGLRHVVPKVWAAFPSSPVPQQLLDCVARAQAPHDGPGRVMMDLGVCFPDGWVHTYGCCPRT